MSIRSRQDAVNDAAAFGALLAQVIDLTRRFTAAGERMARTGGQTLARWLVLEQVQNDPAPVADVARALHLARQSVQRVADLLVADGLASYEENPRHRRAKLLRPTEAGRGALRTIQAEQRAWAGAVGAGIGADRLAEAAAILAEVRRAVEAAEPAE
jgi:DNA-binding MarR family transcriptional regulator